MKNDEIKVFEVKEESINLFFEEHLVIDKNHRSISIDDIRKTNPYLFFKHELMLKKSSGFRIGENIVFELKNKAQYSTAVLTHTYTYIVNHYDDICIKMELVDFKVTISPEAKPSFLNFLN